MTNLNSLFLSQAYKDCWDDYNRSLKLRSFPRWDYVILTASNEQQAEGFRKQIADRQNFLPRGTKFIAIPDRDGRRVGSGGATLEVLRYLHEQEGSFDSLRVLVIHSGGDSKRVPHGRNGVSNSSMPKLHGRPAKPPRRVQPPPRRTVSG